MALHILGSSSRESVKRHFRCRRGHEIVADSPDMVQAYVRALFQFIVGRRKMPPEGIALPEKAAQKRGKAVKKGTKKSRKGATGSASSRR